LLVDLRTMRQNNPTTVQHETFQWSEDQRLVRRTRGQQDNEPSVIETWRFDAEGRETLRTRAYPTSKTASGWFQETRYNHVGMKLEVARGKSLDIGPTWREMRSYVCD